MIFLDSPETAKLFSEYSSKYPNMNFIVELEELDSLLFLSIKFFRKSQHLVSFQHTKKENFYIH